VSIKLQVRKVERFWKSGLEFFFWMHGVEYWMLDAGFWILDN
jgi:hypothetical protein